MGCNTVFDYTVEVNDLSKTPIIQLGSKKKNLFLPENLLIEFQPFSNHFFLVLGRGWKLPRTIFPGGLM